jgi:hypothetical protein
MYVQRFSEFGGGKISLLMSIKSERRNESNLINFLWKLYVHDDDCGAHKL